MIVKLFFLYDAALLLDHFGPGKKICEESTIGVILMGSQFCEYILQIIINPETVGFGGLHQTVHDGTGLGTTDGIHIDPVLTTDSERADGALSHVVVHGNITVMQKDTEIRFLIQTVLQGFVGVATDWNGLHGSGQKSVEFLIEDVQVNLCGAHHPVGHGAHPQGKSGG